MSSLSSKPVDEFRLPTDVKPTHYDVTIRTDLQKLTFEGFVKINLDVKKDTSTIVLNSADLEFGDTSVYSEALKSVQVQSSRAFDAASERATLAFPTTLPAGSKALLQIGFRGTLTGHMMGYYKSSWEHDGKLKHYALTQFEPTAARRAFPCWDEPLLKATFAVTMVSRADTVNLSNMPVASETMYQLGNQENAESVSSTWAKHIPSFAADDAADEWKITHFETTPPMSTYLVAYANGHFEHLESSYKSPISGKTRPLRIYATSDVIHQAQFALDVKASVMPLYEQVFEIEYPLPKLDTLVAHDFDAGAMENWGLITGRTRSLLLDPNNADLATRKYVAAMQLHECAHMWFGNITTMEWWDYLYLNEGFATLMGEDIIADKVFPEWKMDSEFITVHLNDALRLDAKLSSHPIEVRCPDANQINQIFDSLSYAKAASVLRMLSMFVGEEGFLKGVSLYLKKHLYGNTVTKDLWKGIESATGIDVTKIMDNWVSKIGFPVLTVTEGQDGIRIRQDRFLETGPAESKDNETIWTIPLSLLSADENGKISLDKTAILDEREKNFSVDTSKPFKLNAGTTGVYRVLYSPERLAKIASEAAKGDAIFSLNDRIGLVHDAMALAKAGFSSVSSALNVINILRHEKEFLVWGSISTNLTMLVSTWWEQPKTLELLDAFRRELYKPLVDKLGYDYSASDSADTVLLRTSAIGQAAAAKDKDVIAELRRRFSHFMKTGDDSQIPADLQRTIFATSVRHGGRDEYEFAKKIHEQPKTPTARMAAMIAMGASEDPKFAEETLQYTLTNVRDQDIMYFFAGLSGNFTTRRILAKFFMKEYGALYKRFEGNFTFKNIVEISCGSFSTKKDYQEVAEFFKDKDTSKYNLSLSQTLDSIHARTEWLERSSGDMLEWLENWEKAKV